MAENTTTIAFTGGGTAGHVFPAFPVIDRARQAGYRVIWIGSRQGMERTLVEDAGIPYFGIPAGKLRRYWSFRNITDLFRVLCGFFASLRILRREKPAVLVSKGGFVSVPPVAAARLRRIPSFTHESDVDPGLATRLNLSLGARPLISYDLSRTYLPARVRGSASLVGNPVRDAVLQGDRDTGRRLAGLVNDDGRPLVLVLGGSQGAREVNDLVIGALDDLLEVAAVVHQTGPGNPGVPDRPGYMARSFFSGELPHLLAAADLAVGRSGAGSVWEFAATGTPAVFIPLRGATRGDQMRNAETAAEAGMAVILEAGARPADLAARVRSILGSPERQAAMARASAAYPAREAADRFFAAVKEVVG